ncbi:MAG TPA: zinc ribbon domain-containing protein [Verrucomicrobiales bacterium]|nr:zinc ribbon domain-containing protein [Verrucomicrobiales bacterium]|tara:strand:- start:734 stop:1006 length:273 start_codon:yes stop_codon:yes gene_type:complete
MPPDYCPNCGAAVPARASACPECGADEDTGWNDDAYAQGLGLPDEDFDYDEFVEREFGETDRPTLKPQGLHWFWWLVALGLVVAMLSFWF